MIISRCPLRVSLIGGSTDSPDFLNKYGSGQVISFTPNLYTYVFLNKDCNGFNNLDKKYVISYSKLERTSSIEDINNELVRECFLYFDIDPVKISFEADVFSEGSGLASSSSFILNLVNCLARYKGIQYSISDICRISFDIESKINPKNGYQDTYGCAFGGFKKISFEKSGDSISYSPISAKIFQEFDSYLIYTNKKRSSFDILSKYSRDESLKLIPLVEKAYECILEENFFEFFDIINQSWTIKKSLSSEILNDNSLRKLDSMLLNDPSVLCHKLCGAGGGGYFLAFTKKNDNNAISSQENPYIKIKLDNGGLVDYNKNMF